MFKIDITEERSDYFSKRGKVVLSACPGSGKTTVLTYKFGKLIDEVTKKHGKYAGVLCLSFTNIAKEEILDKFRLIHEKNVSFPSEVLTINSFINNYITLPFYRYLSGKDIRPQILEDKEFNELIISHIHYRAYTINNKALYFSYPPSKFKFTESGDLDAPHTLPSANEIIFQKYAKKIKSIQLSLGVFKNDQSVYIASKIIEKTPRIAGLLTKRFPYILVDESQDTSEEQLNFLKTLLDYNLDGLELVGDYYQSLYEWRDARPDLFFSLTNNSDWQKCELNSCRRSVQPIIDAYSLIRSSNDPHITSTSELESISNPVQIILYESDTPIKAIQLYKELSSDYSVKRVVVRGKKLLNKINGKYTATSPWKKDLPLNIINSYKFLKEGKIKKAINSLRNGYVSVKNPDLKYYERTLLGKELKSDNKFNAYLLSLLKKMPSTSLSLVKWTQESEIFWGKSFDLEDYSFELKQGIWRSKHSSTVDEILSIEDSNLSIELSTIHGAKGLTLESIFLLLDSTSSPNSLNINDFSQCDDLPNEKQRLLYVAMSRPKSLLVIGIPKENCTKEEAIAIFGEKIVTHET